MDYQNSPYSTTSGYPYGNYNQNYQPQMQQQQRQFNPQPQMTPSVQQMQVQGRNIYAIPVTNIEQAQSYSLQDIEGFYVFVNVSPENSPGAGEIYTRQFFYDTGGDKFVTHLNRTPPPPPPKPATMEDITRMQQDFRAQMSAMIEELKGEMINVKHESKADADANGPEQPKPTTNDKPRNGSRKEPKPDAVPATGESE